jgi:hypothetical protein
MTAFALVLTRGIQAAATRRPHLCDQTLELR